MYKCYIVENNQIYWSKDSLDKPSKRCFDEIVKRLQWIELENTPNFVTEYICELVLNKETYNYMKLVNTDTNQITYWFNSGTNKALKNNMYLVKYEMDIFSSYTYDVIPLYMNKGYPITVNRSTYLPFQVIPYVYSLDDDLLPPFREYTTIPINPIEELNTQLRDGYGVNYGTKTYNNRIEISAKDSPRHTEVRFQSPVYEIELAPYHGEFEIMGESITPNPARDKQGVVSLEIQPKGAGIVCDTWRVNDMIILLPVNCNMTLKVDKPSVKTINFTGTPYMVDLIKRTFKPQNYIGRFTIPNFHFVVSTTTQIMNFKTKTRLGSGSQATEYWPIENIFLFWVHPSSNRVDLQDYHLARHTKYDYIKSDWISTSEIKPCDYVVHKFRQVSNNTPWNNKSWLINNLWLDGAVNYIFDPVTGYTITGDMKDERFWNTMFRGYETLPTSQDEYGKFRQSQQSQLSTGMTNAIVQSTVGGVFSLAGGIGGIATKNVDSAIGGFGGAVENITGAVAYSESQKAMLTDRRRSNTDKAIYSTSDFATILNMYSMKSPTNYHSMYRLFVKGYNNKYDIRTANRIVWENGMKVGGLQFTLDDINALKIPTLSNYYYHLDAHMDVVLYDIYQSYKFLYWDWNFDTNYIKDVIPAVKQSLLLKVIDSLNKPVRFWNKGYIPEYTDTALDNTHFVDYSTQLPGNLSVR